MFATIRHSPSLPLSEWHLCRPKVLTFNEAPLCLPREQDVGIRIKLAARNAPGGLRLEPRASSWSGPSRLRMASGCLLRQAAANLSTATSTTTSSSSPSSFSPSSSSSSSSSSSPSSPSLLQSRGRRWRCQQIAERSIKFSGEQASSGRLQKGKSNQSPVGTRFPLPSWPLCLLSYRRLSRFVTRDLHAR